jgi:hypothetical protein
MDISFAIGLPGSAVSASPAAFRTRHQGMPAVCGGDAGAGEERVPSVPAFLPLLGNCLPRDKRPKSPKNATYRKLRPIHDDRLRRAILCRIAHIPPGASSRQLRTSANLLASVTPHGEERHISLPIVRLWYKNALNRSSTGPALTKPPYETKVVRERSSLPLCQIF